MHSSFALVPVVLGLALPACKGQPSSPPAPAPAPAPAPLPAPAAANIAAKPAAKPGAPAPSPTDQPTPRPTPIVVAMPGPDDVRAALALRCSTRKAGSGCTGDGAMVAIPFDCEEPVLFKQSGLALVKHEGQSWTFVNARNQTVFDSFLFDNGPDELQDGRARVVLDGKIGFVDDEWRLIVPPQFDSAFGFEGGKARVCVGCDPRIWSHDEPPEARAQVGREFWIDRAGNEVASPAPAP